MKRSGREARWADIPSARTRFTAEAAFLILVAGGAALARLSPLSIIVLMLVAWLLVAVGIAIGLAPQSLTSFVFGH